MNDPPMETELKLDVDRNIVVNDYLIASFGRPAGKRHLVSTYFDTADKRLWHAGITLRVRRDGECRIQTIKAEHGKTGGLFIRPEWERDISGDTPEVDATTRNVLTGLGLTPVIANTLVAQFTTDIERTLWRVEIDGTGIEIASDDGTIRADRRTVPVHELEIERKRGPDAALFGLAARIVAKVPVRIGVQSKAERGYALCAKSDGRALKAESIILDRDMTVSMGFQAIVRACLRHYRLNEALLLAAPQPENLHQCRVALRRLRSALALFKRLLRDPESLEIRGRLREAAKSFAEARNIDVLISRVGDAAPTAVLAVHRKGIYAQLLAALQSASFRRLMLDLTAWINIGAWLSEPDTAAERNRPIDRFAAHVLRRYRHRLKQHGKHLRRAEDADRHAVRILAKKLRYAAEFFGSLFPGKKALARRKQFMQAVESLQTELGNLNDVATGAQLLKRLGVHVAMAKGRRLSPAIRPADAAAEAYETLVGVKSFWA